MLDGLVEKYVNFFTDYGFKKLFGQEPNKDLLLDFLNELLKEQEGQIVNLTYLNSEHLGDTKLDRKAIFDLYCENERGEKFIVELQKSKQNFFKDRTVFYASFPIKEQGLKAGWDYQLKAVYTVAILDFVFEEDKHETEKYRYDVKLTDIETCKVFYDKLTFIYLEMPKFNKSIDELETRFEKWLYILKNLHDFDRIPDNLREKVFIKLFETAEIARFNREELRSYESSLKTYRDLYAVIETAKDEGLEKGFKEGHEKGVTAGMEKGLEQGLEQGIKQGIEQGIEQGIKSTKLETIIKGLQEGLSIEMLSKLTDLSVQEIKALIEKGD